jgi:hypothetical protein
MGNWEDDRPIKLPGSMDMSYLNGKAGDIIEKYPECKEPYVEKKDVKDIPKP